MKILFLGGTGNISTACVERALARGHHVGTLTRGSDPLRPRSRPSSATATTRRPSSARRRRLGRGRGLPRLHGRRRWSARSAPLPAARASTSSSAPRPPTTSGRAPADHRGRAAREPVLGVRAAQDRVRGACCERHREGRLPVTIVRPSYTYGPTWIPSGFGGQDYTVVDRMRRGKPVICHGDGTALWVMTHAAISPSGSWASSARGGPRRGLPRHERRGPHLGRDLRDDRPRRRRRGPPRPRAERAHRGDRPGPGGEPPRRQGPQQCLRQRQGAPRWSRSSGRG